MILRNTTSLDTSALLGLFCRHAAEWEHDGLRVFVRHTRTAPFSGMCYYREGRILLNIGRAVVFPYRLSTCIARAESDARSWWREAYTIDVPDAERLALFVFLHEFYHWLVYRARRNPRQKESRCDRFAVRALVDEHGSVVRDRRGRPVPRDAWDFQDLDGFVGRARRVPRAAAG